MLLIVNILIVFSNTGQRRTLLCSPEDHKLNDSAAVLVFVLLSTFR